MNTFIKLGLLFVGILLTSCTDVIEVEVPEAAPKLVIEASIDWEKGTTGSVQTINLSLSTPYFDEDQLNPVTNATVKVTNNATGAVFNFTNQNNGSYRTYNFKPVVNNEYDLEVVYNNETYTATETLMPVVAIDEVYQSIDEGFDKDALEVNVLFTDPAGIENFYLMKFQRKGGYLAELFDISDEFTDGNQMSIFYEDEEFVVGDMIDIQLFGISKQYYNYIRLLIEQASDGGPFATIPAQLKGNCINTSNPENNAYGYFRLTQVAKESITFIE
ncbi:DUF4249 domain-containing protein [Lutibacter holmesii]|uniref:DUF4249 domain-containing protein n=1 Tax=Lutibacter holmesii TaxID=1137985 RepID=A0ABW3WM87_9FLAO